MITIELLQKVCPGTKKIILEKYVDPLYTIALYYDIADTKERTAAFIAQLAHESGGFNTVIENLNYSAEGLTRVFPKYFPTLALANQYARNPEKIANRVYANRMKNGDEASGDGWKFRGRGLVQLTGKDNYTKFAQSLEMDLDATVEYLETPSGAAVGAGWFWDTNKLNSYCDKNDFIGLTKRINGGTNGLADRQHHYEVALQYLKV
jgi:putative chitinase